MNSPNSVERIENEMDIDIKELWRIIRNHAKMIFIIFIIIFFLTLYITVTTQPIYQASTSLMIKERAADPSSFVFDFGAGNSNQILKNEIEILKSYNLHNQVIQSLIGDGSSSELALFGTRYTRKRYRLTDYVFGWLNQSSETVSLGRNMSIGERIIVVDKLRNSSGISTLQDTDVLTISITSTDSSESVFLANRVSKIYQDLDLAGGLGELRFMLTFLDSQITQYEQRLAIVEEDLQKFQSENGIYSLDGSSELLLSNLTEYENIYFTNIAELEVAGKRIEYLESLLSENEKRLMSEITNTNNPMIIALRGKIAELEAQKVQQMVEEGWDENSLQGRDYNRRIGEMKDRLTKATESLILSGWSEDDPFAASQIIFNKIIEQQVDVHAARSRSDQYKILVGHLSRRLDLLPSQTLQYARLERDLKLNENLYLTMRQKYEESRITEAGQRGKVQILDPALVAIKVKPNKKKNVLLGVLFGFLIGVGVAFLKEFFDNTIKAVEQLERKGLSVLGIVPDMFNDSKIKTAQKRFLPSEGGKEFQRRLITHEDPKSPISESYRTLRTNVIHALVGKEIKSVLVSSPQPGEGKSTTVANLAIAFAQLRKRTILIDADLRKPVQHNVFGMSRGPGLAEYLNGEVDDVESIIHKTKVDNLFLMTAGSLPPNPSELLGSIRMGNLVKEMEKKWDMTLFDSPPIVAVTDSSMISSEIDSLLMVVKAGQTDRMSVDRALDTIANVTAPLIGVILNGANPKTMSGKYSYYYAYNNYYYNSDDKTK